MKTNFYSKPLKLVSLLLLICIAFVQKGIFARNGTTAKIYIDGLLSNTGTVPLTNISNSDNLSIGHSGANPFAGSLDDIKIYSGALTDTEVASKYAEENTPTTITCGTPAPVLVANYTFCGNANDTSPNANNGTVNGATLTADRFGNLQSAYSFDGNDYISAPSSPALQFGTGEYSMNYWFKSSTTNLGALVMKSSGGGFGGIANYFNYPGARQIQARSDFGASALNSTPIPNDNQWHMITYTRSGASSKTHKLYVDGVLNQTNTTTQVIDVNNNTQLDFGVFNDHGQQWYTGDLDDIKFFSGVLSDADILAEFNSTSSAGCTPIVCPTITVSVESNLENECDGTATFSATGGMSNYTFTSLNGGTISGNSFTAKAGTYTIQATDAKGCTATTSINITNNDAVAPTFSNCPSNISVTADANCTKVVTWNLPTASDNCNPPEETIAGFTYKGNFNGKGYYLSNASADFETAKANCIMLGGNMLVINSAAENSFINSVVGQLYILLGITDAVTEGTWLDIFGQPATYFNWNGGEPNNASGGTGEDFVTTNAGGWNDQAGNSGQYILEKGLLVIQTAGLASGAAFPIGTTTNTFTATDAAGNTAFCSFTVNVNPSVTAEISYASAAICANSGEYQPSITGAQGGSFSINPSSGLIVNATMGTINTLNATTGNYTITYNIAASGSCPAITDAYEITVNAAPEISCPQNIEICKNSTVFNLPNIPTDAIVTVGGVTNTSGTFDPSADWSAFPNGVPVIYSITNMAGCSSTCSYIILVKRLPNSVSSVYFTSNSASALSVCKNSGDVQLRFDGGTGSMDPFTYYYTINNGAEQNIGTSVNTHLFLSTATAGTFAYRLTRVKIGNGCESIFNNTATLIVNELPDAPSATPTQPTCTVGTGSITINTSATGYSFDDGANFQASNNKAVLNPGTYKVKIKDVNGCISAATTIIIEQQPGTPDAPTNFMVQHPACDAATGNVKITYPVANHSYYLDGTLIVNNSIATSPGAHTLVVKNAAGCESAGSTVNLNNTPVSPANPEVSVIQTSCTVSTGSISIGGLTGVTYSFGGSFSTNNSSGPLSAGDYLVKIKSAAGCESPGQTIKINAQPASPVVPELTSTPTNCNNATGSITVVSPTDMSYQLDNGVFQTGLTFTNVSAGSHTITVKNVAGCTAFAAISVGSDSQAPTVNMPPNLSVCKDSEPITLSGATPAGGIYSGINVVNGIFTPNTTGQFTITYTVNGSNGCAGSNTFSINVSPKFSVAVQPTAGSFSVCEGTTMAGFQFVANGASHGATSFSVKYKLGENGTEQTVSTTNSIAVVNVDASIPGTFNYYFLDAFDSENCPSGAFGSLTFTVKAKPAIACPLPIEALSTDPIIILGTTGVYAGTGVSLNNTTGNYEFNPATAGVGMLSITKTILGANGCQNSCAFTIKVTASNICTNTATISYPIASSCATGATIPPTLLGTSGGTFTSSPTGLSINSTTGVIDPSASLAGYYTVSYTLMATETCPVVSSTALISIKLLPTANTLAAEDFCQGNNDLVIQFTGLQIGTNQITVAIKTVGGPSWTPQVLTVEAASNGTGAGTFNIGGFGTELFEISIQNIVLGTCEKTFTGITDTFTKKPNGSGTSVNFTSNTVCFGSNLSVNITGVQNSNFAHEVTYKIVNLADNSESAPATITVPAGSANTLALSIAAPSAAGNYKLIITSMYIADCGLSTNLMANFTVLPKTIVSATLSYTKCNGGNNLGAIDLTVTGGSGSYSYLWSNNEISQDLNNLPIGNYTVVITESNGCAVQGNTSFEILQSIPIVLSAVTTNPVCYGYNGSVEITASGGNGTISFTTNPNTGVTFYNSSFTGPAGNYVLTATDRGGCAVTTAITISNPINSKPDLSPTIMEPSNTSFLVGDDFTNGYLQIINTKNAPTSGIVKFRVTKLTGFDIVFPENSYAFDFDGSGVSKPLSNGLWVIDSITYPGFIEFTMPSGMLACQSTTNIGFKIKPKEFATSSSTGILTVSILNGFGGDINIFNNQSVLLFSIN